MERIISFLAGILLTSLILLWIIPSFKRNAIRKALKQELFDKPLPLSFHTFLPDELRRILGATDPRIYREMDSKLLEELHRLAREKYHLHLQTAIQGVHSDAEMAIYLKESGILGEMGLNEQEALSKMEGKDVSQLLVPPKEIFTRYHALQIPPSPVRYPAEFEPINAVLLGWPIYYPYCWKIHAAFTSEIVSEAKALIIVPGPAWQKVVEIYLEFQRVNLEKVRFVHIPLDDVWTRDYGPTLVLSGADQHPVFICNPYVMSYQSYTKLDAEIPQALAQILNVPAYRLPLVVEGGNLMSDGQGTMILLESILEKNPDVGQVKLKRILEQYYGCERLIGFPPLPGELTGHVDMVVKFANIDTVLVASADQRHPWHDLFDDMANKLGNTASANGGKYQVVCLPIPRLPRESTDVWSYINSLILNHKVIVPIFGVPEDETAMRIYQDTFEGHEVVGINFSRYPLGSVHCQSKELPTAENL